MQRITALYVSLRGLLSDQLREVDFCRARLQDLTALFTEAAGVKNGPQPTPGAGRYLSANGCKSVDDAVKQLEAAVGPEELVELDKRMQALIRTQFKALLHVCVTSANVLKSLAPAMHKEARAFLRARLGDSGVADIYLQQFQVGQNGDDTRLEDDLAEVFEAASPDVVASPAASELNFLAMPPGPCENRVRAAAANAVDGRTLMAASSTDEITIYREHTLACLADLDQLGPLAQEAYEKVLKMENATPHSRCDITEWQTRSKAGERGQ